MERKPSNVFIWTNRKISHKNIATAHLQNLKKYFKTSFLTKYY